MADELRGRTVAALVTHGFEEVELTEPRRALREAGADIHIIAPEGGAVRGWNRTDWGDSVQADTPVSQARADDYDALLLPGGVMNPDKLRMHEGAVAFVKAFVDAGKPIAAICHAPWTLIEAGGVKGRKMTSYPSLRSDLVHAGATWVDEAAVVDDALITSRRPDDIPEFNRAMLQVFAARTRERAAPGA